MRRLPTTVFITIGAIALGVGAYAVLSRNGATADSTPGSTSGTSTSSTTSPSTSSAPEPAPPTTRPRPTATQTHAVDPGMVLSGEHVVTSTEVFSETETASGEPSDK